MNMALPKIKTSYHKLAAFQKAKQLALLVYKITQKFPREEQFSLVSQMRRAAVSVLANIVEGYSRGSTKEYIRFLNIAIGSATELKVYLEISLDLRYLNQKTYKEAESLLVEVLKLLYSYKQSLGNRVKEKNRVEE